MAHAQAHAADHLVEALWACAAAHTAAASIVSQAVGAAGDVLYAHYIGSKQVHLRVWLAAFGPFLR